MKSNKRLLGFILFLFTAPLWTRYTQQIGEQNLFLKTDSLLWLGGILLMGILFKYIPQTFFKFVDLTVETVKRHFKILSIIFLIFIFSLLIFINQNILHSFMNSADEHSCYFLAECIRSGRLWANPPPVARSR